MHKLGWFMVVLMFTLLPGCSRFGTALRWADTFFIYYITDYVELNSSQKGEMKGDFNSVLSQIRQEDFPRFAKILNGWADQIETHLVTAELVRAFWAEGEREYRQTLKRFLPLAKKLIAIEASHGFQRLDEKLSDKRDEDNQTAQDPKRVRRKQRERIDKTVEQTIGDLTDSQTKLVEAFLDRSPQPLHLQIESKNAMHDKFKTVRARPSTRDGFIETLMTNWESLQTVTYLKARRQYTADMQDLIAKIGASLTDKQKKSLVDNLRKRARELTELKQK